MNIELYINKQLCDIEDIKKFSIAFKRQLLNPAELNTKDAQKSYDITLPTTNRNNGIFGFKNIEEVQGKFAIIYDAYLIVGGVKIFDGKFRLSEISIDYYKGNLGVPYRKPINQLFGDKKLKDAGEWLINDFNSFYESISKINQDAKLKPQPCIFPLILYGLVPKESKDNGYTDKLVIDQYTDLRFDDLPPAINPLKALREIFKNEGYDLGGSAFNDPKLVNLYMSYKNNTDYSMHWSREATTFHLKGDYTIAELFESTISPGYEYHKADYDNKAVLVEHDKNYQWVANILNSDKNNYKIIRRGNNNILSEDNKIVIRIHKSGLYKVNLKGKLSIVDHSKGDAYSNWWGGDSVSSITIRTPNPLITNYIGRKNKQGYNNDFQNKRFELQLVRYTADEFIDISQQKILGCYARPNQNQDSNPTAYGLYPNHKLFVDASNNENFICGGSFGRCEKDKNINYEEYIKEDSPNSDLAYYPYANTMYIANGKSWDNTYSKKRNIFAVTPIYKKGSYDYRYRHAKGTKINNVISWDITKSDIYDNQIYNYEDDLNAKINNTNRSNFTAHQIVYLNEGDCLTLLDVSDAGYCRDSQDFIISGEKKTKSFESYTALICHSWQYELIVEPFRESLDWLKMNNYNHGTDSMNWIDYEDHLDKLDLIKFLPAEDKIDTFIDNFCKAFNLSLIQTKERKFELNVKQTQSISRTSYIIDLDNKADVNLNRANSSLNLPSAYEIGFTVNKDEQGYIETGEDGGGKYITGSTEKDPLKQTSTFSYCWYKQMYNRYNQELPLFPIISNKEVWEQNDSEDYADMQKKRYTNLAQRFFYIKDTYQFPNYVIREQPYLALVSSYLGSGNITLDYKNKPNSILTTYFNLLTNNENCYTTIDCYLTPEEYNNITNSIVKLNGDLYYIAEIDGYDPLGRRKATLKLIRKIL